MSRKRLKEERSKKEGGTALSSFPEVVNGRFQERHAVQNANSLHSPFKSEDNILGQLSVQNRGVMIPDPESDFHFFVLPDPDPVKCQIVTPIEVL